MSRNNPNNLIQVRTQSIRADPIGSTAVSVRRHNRSLRRSLLARGNSKEIADSICLRELNSDQVIVYWNFCCPMIDFKYLFAIVHDLEHSHAVFRLIFIFDLEQTESECFKINIIKIYMIWHLYHFLNSCQTEQSSQLSRTKTESWNNVLSVFSCVIMMTASQSDQYPVPQFKSFRETSQENHSNFQMVCCKDTLRMNLAQMLLNFTYCCISLLCLYL